MSRLIVKNLANSVTAEHLKQVFSEKGNVTDVQLKYKSDGSFRHFGFVGFQKEEDAQQALEYFDKTFIKGSRVSVELCSKLGDFKKQHSPTKGTSEKSAIQEISKDKKQGARKKKEENDSVVKEVLKKYEDDPVFSEFMEACTKGKQIWSNDFVSGNGKEDKSPKNKTSKSVKKEEDRGCDSGSSDKECSGENKTSKIAEANISDLEYLKMKMKTEADSKELSLETSKQSKKPNHKQKEKKNCVFYTVKIRGVGYKTTKSAIRQFFSPVKPCSIRLKAKVHTIAYVGFATEKEMKIALRKNQSFIDGKRVSVIQYGGDVKHSIKVRNSNNKWEAQSENLKDEESIGESGRIFVRNLAYTVSEADLESLFAKFGPLTEVTMPIDRISRKSKGFAVITFLFPEHAIKAYMELDGSIFNGRMLHLLPGKAKKSIEEMMDMEGLTYKQKKALKLKAQAAASYNWNTLFLGQNAVADLIAKNYNIEKEKVLDVRTNESLAVRLALGETQIVNETRQFLLDNGVHLDAFNQPATQRSKTVILAKNLPAETQRYEILRLFGSFGELGRVLLPPSGVTAIVEFLEPSEARAAFRKLAYTKFKYSPLYLEWAPDNAFSTAFSGRNIREETKEDNKEENEGVDTAESSKAEQEGEVSSSEEEDEGPEPDTTLFIKNLNFKTREDAIKEHFQKCGPIHNVTVAMKKDSQNPGKLISQGYGFIQFKRKESLEKALKSYQNSVLDEYSLELKRSNRTLQVDVVTARKPTKVGKQRGSKILVRNIPFQATMKEVRELFKTFGEIKALRLPQKMAGTGSHRGFAFVEYYTRHEAKRAFKALSQSTHLYGRRLVLEWANTEEDIGDIRRKTANQFMNVSSHYQPGKGTANIDVDMKSPEDDI